MSPFQWRPGGVEAIRLDTLGLETGGGFVKELRGRTALVTGASRGIGAHLVRALADQGMNLVISSRTESALEAPAEEARSRGATVRVLAADLSDRLAVESLADRAEAAFGGIDILVNNAAIEGALRYQDVDPGVIDEMMAVNLAAPMLLTRLLLPHMIRRGRGHVVNMSSLAGLVGTPYEELYSATKHGLVGFSRSLTLTLGHEGHPIGVSVICPAFVQDAGMYHTVSSESGAEAPLMIGTVSMEKVASAVVRAIVRNEPEVVLSGKPMRPFLITQVISPRLAGRMSSMVGVPQMFRKWADAATARSL